MKGGKIMTSYLIPFHNPKYVALVDEVALVCQRIPYDKRYDNIPWEDIEYQVDWGQALPQIVAMYATSGFTLEDLLKDYPEYKPCKEEVQSLMLLCKAFYEDNLRLGEELGLI